MDTTSVVIKTDITQENIRDLLARAKTYMTSLFNQAGEVEEQIDNERPEKAEEAEEGEAEEEEAEEEEAEEEENVQTDKKGMFSIDSKNIRLADIYIEDFTKSLSGITPPPSVPLVNPLKEKE
jgi:ribosomal protein L12E/L44/L45/RPP1/RPP2